MSYICKYVNLSKLPNLFLSLCFLIDKMDANILSIYRIVSINWEIGYVWETMVSSDLICFPLSALVVCFTQPSLQLHMAIGVWVKALCASHRSGPSNPLEWPTNVSLSPSAEWKGLLGAEDRSHEMQFTWIPVWPCGIDHLLKRSIHIRICLKEIQTLIWKPTNCGDFFGAADNIINLSLSRRQAPN